MYVVATDASGELLGIATDPLNVSQDAARALTSRSFEAESHGGYMHAEAAHTTTKSDSDTYETPTEIVVVVRTLIFVDGVLVKVDIHVIRIPKKDLLK